jgi:HK97 family phage portal protein
LDGRGHFITGFAYWRILELYADTFRIRRVERIAPTRIGTFLNDNGTEVLYYTIDGNRIPETGVGSVVVFYGNDEGLLNRAGTTIRAGAELERAATMYAREPMPTMILKSNGASLPPDRIAKLLESWGQARRNRSTAFLNADVTLDAVGFDPEKMQLNAARNYISTELSRAIGIPAYFTDAPTGSSMTYSNATLAKQSLLDFSLIPIMTSIEERLSMPDFTPSSQVARFDLDAYLRGSAIERAQVYEVLNRIGALSIEEIQRKEDMIL